MLEVKFGVMNEPLVPTDWPLGETQVVLPAEDQLTVAEAPFAIDDGVTIRLTEGLDVSMVVDPSPPPPQEASPDTANSTAKITLMKLLESRDLLLEFKDGAKFRCSFAFRLGDLLSWQSEY